MKKLALATTALALVATATAATPVAALDQQEAHDSTPTTSASGGPLVEQRVATALELNRARVERFRRSHDGRAPSSAWATPRLAVAYWEGFDAAYARGADGDYCLVTLHTPRRRAYAVTGSDATPRALETVATPACERLDARVRATFDDRTRIARADLAVMRFAGEKVTSRSVWTPTRQTGKFSRLSDRVNQRLVDAGVDYIVLQPRPDDRPRRGCAVIGSHDFPTGTAAFVSLTPDGGSLTESPTAVNGLRGCKKARFTELEQQEVWDDSPRVALESRVRPRATSRAEKRRIVREAHVSIREQYADQRGRQGPVGWAVLVPRLAEPHLVDDLVRRKHCVATTTRLGAGRVLYGWSDQRAGAPRLFTVGSRRQERRMVRALVDAGGPCVTLAQQVPYRRP